MSDTALSLVIAALLFGVALVAWLVGRAVSRRAGTLREQLRALDARLVHETPMLAARMGAQRTHLAAQSAATERALWSLSRFDERVEATRTGLATRRAAVEKDRARLIGARMTIIRVRKSAQMIIKLVELRRAILG